jgi:hypothetical protein
VAPPTKKSLVLERKKVEVPPKVVRALKMADEEDELKAEKPVKAIPEPTPLVNVPIKELDAQAIKAPLVKKRKLKMRAEPTAPVVEPTAPMIETTAPAVKTTNVAGFLAT